MTPLEAHRPAEEIHACCTARTVVILGTDGAGKTTAGQGLVHGLVRNGFGARFAANVSGRRWLTGRARDLGITFPTLTQDLVEATIRYTNVAVNSLRARNFNGLTVMDRHLYCQLVLRRLRGQPLGLLMPWLAHKSLERSVVAVLDVDPAVAFDRVAAREDDSETMEYLQESRDEYLRLAKENGWTVLDASRPLPDLVAELRSLAGYPAARAGVRADDHATSRR